MKKRILALFLGACMLLGSVPAQAVTAKTPDVRVLIDGEEVRLRAYNIGGANYFKLRDLAFALRSTDKAFDVQWDAESQTVMLFSHQAYVPVGGECAEGAYAPAEAKPSTHRVTLDGKPQSFAAYHIGGANYFKLRDVLGALDIAVDWIDVSRTITISTAAAVDMNQIVTIRCADEEDRQSGAGYGVLVSKDGKILTNYDIMKRAARAKATWNKDGKQYEITGFLAYDKKRNLALMQSTIVTDTFAVLAQQQPSEGARIVLATSKTEEGWIGSWIEDEYSKGRVITPTVREGEWGAPVFTLSGELCGVAFARGTQFEIDSRVAPADAAKSWLLRTEVTSFEAAYKQNYPLSGTKTISDVLSLVGAQYATLSLPEGTVKISKIGMGYNEDRYKSIDCRIEINDVQAGTRMFDRMEAGDDEEQCRALKSYTKKVVATIRNYFPEYEVCGEVYVRARSNLEPSADDEIEDVTAVHGGWEFNARVFWFEATDLKGFCTMR